MCGIVGFAGRGTREDVQAMCDAIVHRGPDDGGIYFDGRAGLGNRRLSIIDLAGGHQPLCNEDETAWITFNGETYNFPELRQTLSALGHVFRTRTDTEAIVHAYESYGDECVQALNAMFAFAIWDGKAERLLLARDRLGIKPLYYAHLSDGTLVFASEIKALLNFHGMPRALDPLAFDQYMRLQYVPAPRTIWQDIKKLPAGHRLIWQAGQIKLQAYWQPYFQPQTDVPESEWLTLLDAQLTRSVQMQLQSDVPVGAFLSGGVDSTAVVARMQALTERPVKTFTIGFADTRYDESEFARRAAKQLGTEHYHQVVAPGIDRALLMRLIAQLDEPLADPSFIPTYHVSKLASEHVKVVLSGDGGDETFAGYAKYGRALDWSSRERAPIPLARAVMPVSRKLPFGKRTALLMGMPLMERYAELTYGYFSFDSAALYGDALKHAIGKQQDSIWDEIARRVDAQEPLSRLQQADYFSYLPEDILMKVDKMSMAVSLEVRVPLLDHALQELAMRIPAGLKLRAGETKAIFKRALRGRVPDEALDRPKIGFTPTLSYWLGEAWQQTALQELSAGYCVRQGWIQTRGVHALAARRDLVHLWSLWLFEKWAEAYGV